MLSSTKKNGLFFVFIIFFALGLMYFFKIPSSLFNPKGASTENSKYQKKYTPPTEKTVGKAKVDSPRNKFGEILKQAKVLPHKGPKGDVIGFKLIKMKPGSFYETVGLKDGDVITTVNGITINSPGKGLEIYQSIKAGTSKFKIDILRNGKSEVLNYNIK